MHASVIFLAGLLSIPLVSCSPVGGYPGNPVGTQPIGNRDLARVTFPNTATNPTAPTAQQQRELRERREALAAGAPNLGNQGGRQNDLNSGGNGVFRPGNARSSGGPSEPLAQALPPLDIDYRYAMAVPGRKGWVYNPYTNSPVDVRAVASGYLIYDEKDPANRNPDGTLMPVSEMPHKFRVP